MCVFVVLIGAVWASIIYAMNVNTREDSAASLVLQLLTVKFNDYFSVGYC